MFAFIKVALSAMGTKIGRFVSGVGVALIFMGGLVVYGMRIASRDAKRTQEIKDLRSAFDAAKAQAKTYRAAQDGMNAVQRPKKPDTEKRNDFDNTF